MEISFKLIQKGTYSIFKQNEVLVPLVFCICGDLNSYLIDFSNNPRVPSNASTTQSSSPYIGRHHKLDTTEIRDLLLCLLHVLKHLPEGRPGSKCLHIGRPLVYLFKKQIVIGISKIFLHCSFMGPDFLNLIYKLSMSFTYNWS